MTPTFGISENYFKLIFSFPFGQRMTTREKYSIFYNLAVPMYQCMIYREIFYKLILVVPIAQRVITREILFKFYQPQEFTI